MSDQGVEVIENLPFEEEVIIIAVSEAQPVAVLLSAFLNIARIVEVDMLDILNAWELNLIDAGRIVSVCVSAISDTRYAVIIG